MRVFSRISLVIAGSLALAACGGSGGGGDIAAVRPDDLVLGKADAPITVTEYASASCSHCARWNNEVGPQFRAKYVETGQVKLILREILTDNAIAPAGFMTARCAGPDKAFGVIDAIYRNFDALATDARGTLVNIAKSAGLSEQQFNACITDEKGLADLQKRVERNGKDGVTGTPTFFVNGKKLGESGGEQTLAQMDAAIAAAKAGKDPTAAAKAAGPQ